MGSGYSSAKLKSPSSATRALSDMTSNNISENLYVKSLQYLLTVITIIIIMQRSLCVDENYYYDDDEEAGVANAHGTKRSDETREKMMIKLLRVASK